MNDQPILTPASFVRGEPMFSKKDIETIIINETNAGQHVPHREKEMSEHVDNASNALEEATQRFRRVLTNLMDAEAKAAEQSRKASGSVRKAADDLASGLVKVQKTADFASLERHVVLLERAAAALTTLSELDKQGKLDGLIKAMK